MRLVSREVLQNLWAKHAWFHDYERHMAEAAKEKQQERQTAKS